MANTKAFFFRLVLIFMMSWLTPGILCRVCSTLLFAVFRTLLCEWNCDRVSQAWEMRRSTTLLDWSIRLVSFWMYSSASAMGAGASVVELAMSFFTLNSRLSLLRSCWMEDRMLRKLFQWSCRISLWRCSCDSFEAEIAGFESQICVSDSTTSCLWPRRVSSCVSMFFSSPVCSELVVCANVEYFERRDSVWVSSEMALPLIVTKDGCELMWCVGLRAGGLFDWGPYTSFLIVVYFFPCCFYLFFFRFSSFSTTPGKENRTEISHLAANQRGPKDDKHLSWTYQCIFVSLVCTFVVIYVRLRIHTENGPPCRRNTFLMVRLLLHIRQPSLENSCAPLSTWSLFLLYNKKYTKERYAAFLPLAHFSRRNIFVTRR